MATSGEKAEGYHVGRKQAGLISSRAASWREFIGNSLARRGMKSADPDAPVHPAQNGSQEVSLFAADDQLNAVIESDLLPRLLIAHLAAGEPTATDEACEEEAAPPLEFADLPLQLSAYSLLEEVDRFIADGMSVETVYVDVLAPAARRLGTMWERDECDFVDVTMGLWRLQEVMRDIAARSPAIMAPFSEPRSAIFAPMPGDDHSFGAQMIEEVFARAGWASGVLVSPDRRELLDFVAQRPTDLVGLTVSCSCSISALGSLIKAMRSVSSNPHVRILIGGHVVNQDPGIVAEVGADGTGVDAKAALALAERLILAAPTRAYTLT